MLDAGINRSYEVIMSDLRMQWGPEEGDAHRRKHLVSFEEAATVLSDEQAIPIGHPGHSKTEDRFVLLGLSGDLRTPVVCHSYRLGEIIRITSVRRATREDRADNNLLYLLTELIWRVVQVRPEYKAPSMARGVYA